MGRIGRDRILAAEEAPVAEGHTVPPGGFAVHDGVGCVPVRDEKAGTPRIGLLADDADETHARPNGSDRHRGERSRGVHAPASPEFAVFHFDRNLTRYGVDVRGQQDRVVRGSAYVARLVYPNFSTRVLEERREALGALALVARDRGNRDEVHEQVAGRLVGFDCAGAHAVTSASASSSAAATSSAWLSSTTSGGSRRTTVRPAGSASTP